MKNCLILFFVFLILKSEGVVAQTVPDSAKAYFTDLTFFYGAHEKNELKVDTIFKNIYFFDVQKQSGIKLPQTGNPGAASLNLFESNETGKAIDDGFCQFNPYLLSPFSHFPSTLKERRITTIDYHLGSKKEQHIFLRHIQKITPYMMAGIDLGGMVSVGDFSRQKNTNRSFGLWYAYQAPSTIYRGYIGFAANKVENQENGGIAADSVFENASSLDTRTLPVNLDNASMRHKSRDYVLKQDLNISRLFSGKDTTNKFQNFNNGSFVLSHSFWWHRKSILFNSINPDSGYFANVWFDSIATLDSSFINDFYNQAMLTYTSRINENGSYFYVGGGMNLQQVEYFTYFYDSTFINNSIVATGGLILRKLKIDALFSKSMESNFNDSYISQLNFQYLINRFDDFVFLSVSANKTPQSLRDQLYISNHFIWNNKFENEENLQASAGFNISKYKLGFKTRLISVKNLIFYKEDYLPQSYSKNILYGDVTVTKIFKFGKFGMDDKVVFGFSGNQNVVSLPDFSFYSSIYYSNILFKKALGFKAGIDLSWMSSYNGYGYMPSTGIFYLQNEKAFGDYPVAGVFVSMKIKTANLFLRLDHVNAGITDRTYYGAYHYPLPGRTLKFGVSWNLLD